MKLTFETYAESIELVGGKFFASIFKGLRIKENGRFVSGSTIDKDVASEATDILFDYADSLEVKNVNNLQDLIDFLTHNTEDPSIDIIGPEVIASFKLFDNIYAMISYGYLINIEQALIL